MRTAGESVYRITAQLERSGDTNAECPVVMPDAGPVASDAGSPDAGVTPMPTSGGDGCSCRAAGTPGGQSTPGAALVGGLVGLALVLRRRR